MGRQLLRMGAAGRATLATSIYEQMRDDIVAGALIPGEKLRIEALKDRYNSGNSPIREALNRLSMERLVLQLDQRGFIVAPISPEDFSELTEARCALYELLLPRSIEFGDTRWEENIVLSLHRLTRVQWLVGDPPRLNPAARQAHRDFHRSLVAASGSPLLITFMDNLFDLTDRYRMLAQRASDAPGRATSSEHQDLADAAINRDVPQTVSLAQNHVRETARLVRDLFDDKGVFIPTR